MSAILSKGDELISSLYRSSTFVCWGRNISEEPDQYQITAAHALGHCVAMILTAAFLQCGMNETYC